MYYFHKSHKQESKMNEKNERNEFLFMWLLKECFSSSSSIIIQKSNIHIIECFPKHICHMHLFKHEIKIDKVINVFKIILMSILITSYKKWYIIFNEVKLLVKMGQKK